jgi:hypothetical protein
MISVHEFVEILGAIGAIIAAVSSSVNRYKLQRIKVDINGRLQELLIQAHARGKEEEKGEETQRAIRRKRKAKTSSRIRLRRIHKASSSEETPRKHP